MPRETNTATTDLILKNANVITMDTRRPAAELVAIRGDRILLVGDGGELELVTGAKTEVIDCGGKTIVPGFIDAHCHLFSFIRKLLSIDLSPTAVSSIGEIKAAIYRRTREITAGKWITGTGYNEFYLVEKRHPTRGDIDEVAPDHPVVLAHRSLHACVLNSRALALAGITAESEDPPGGFIDRDINTGEPNGILFEMLGDVRKKVLPPLSKAEIAKGITGVNQHYLSLGITSIQEATVTNDLSQWETFRRFKETGNLASRVSMMVGAEAIDQFLESGLTPGSGDNQLRLGGAKIILSEATGRQEPPQIELNRRALTAHRNGFQLAIHAIEESTVAAAITALEYVRSQLRQEGRRHRIEHCAECPPHLCRRLRDLRAVVVTQPPFIYYSGERYLSQVPSEKIPWLYPFKSMMDSGLVVAGSSDAPVVPDNPLVGIYAAVTRKAASGQELTPGERIPARQALAMYTTNAAYASCEENEKGTLSPGKLADMVLLSDDPLSLPREEIKDIRVAMTIIGGKILWASGA